jgi:tetratricopeptide (TPR) repeat protein
MKKIITLLFIIITTLSFGQNNELYKRVGDSLSLEKKYDQLLEYFVNELKTHPKNEKILRWLGYGHFAKNNLDLGIKYYTEALTVNPKCAKCYVNIGSMCSIKGDNKNALENFNKAIEIDSEKSTYYSYRAQIKEILKDQYGALIDHHKAIKLDPDNSVLYLQRGYYNKNSGYPSLAISDFTKAIELTPKNYEPYYGRALVYYDQQRYSAALNDMDVAVKLDSSKHSLYTFRGALLEIKREYSKAIKDYSKAISLNKDAFYAYINKANCHQELEDFDASCLVFSILKKRIEDGDISEEDLIKEVNTSTQTVCNPSNPSYYYSRGVGSYNLKDYHKALDVYTEGLVISPENATLFLFKGNAYLALNEYEKALKFFNLSLKYKDNILPELKNNPVFESASDIEVSNRYNATLSTTYFNIAKCQAILGHFELALTHIDSAMRLLPNDKKYPKEEFFNLRGHIYLTMGKYDLSIADFNKSILINQYYSIAYINRAIAKVSSTGLVKMNFDTITGTINNQPMSVNWNSQSKTTSNESDTKIVSALSDCNTAIDIDNTSGYAYYIRGQLKQMLSHGDFCLDFLTAKEFGLIVEQELLKNCGDK